MSLFCLWQGRKEISKSPRPCEGGGKSPRQRSLCIDSECCRSRYVKARWKLQQRYGNLDRMFFEEEIIPRTPRPPQTPRLLASLASERESGKLYGRARSTSGIVQDEAWFQDTGSSSWEPFGPREAWSHKPSYDPEYYNSHWAVEPVFIHEPGFPDNDVMNVPDVHEDPLPSAETLGSPDSQEEVKDPPKPERPPQKAKPESPTEPKPWWGKKELDSVHPRCTYRYGGVWEEQDLFRKLGIEGVPILSKSGVPIKTSLQEPLRQGRPRGLSNRSDGQDSAPDLSESPSTIKAREFAKHMDQRIEILRQRVEDISASCSNSAAPSGARTPVSASDSQAVHRSASMPAPAAQDATPKSAFTRDYHNYLHQRWQRPSSAPPSDGDRTVDAREAAMALLSQSAARGAAGVQGNQRTETVDRREEPSTHAKGASAKMTHAATERNPSGVRSSPAHASTEKKLPGVGSSSAASPASSASQSSPSPQMRTGAAKPTQFSMMLHDTLSSPALKAKGPPSVSGFSAASSGRGSSPGAAGRAGSPHKINMLAVFKDLEGAEQQAYGKIFQHWTSEDDHRPDADLMKEFLLDHCDITVKALESLQFWRELESAQQPTEAADLPGVQDNVFFKGFLQIIQELVVSPEVAMQLFSDMEEKGSGVSHEKCLETAQQEADKRLKPNFPWYRWESLLEAAFSEAKGMHKLDAEMWIMGFKRTLRLVRLLKHLKI